MGYTPPSLNVTPGTSSYIYGATSTSTNGLYIKANTVDTYPYIRLIGTTGIQIALGTSSLLSIFNAAVDVLDINYDGTDLRIISKVDTKDLYLGTTGTGVVKFGTYTAGAATDSTGYITIKDAGGTTRKLMVQA